MADALSAILNAAIGPAEVKAWPVGPVKLSQALYAHHRAISAATAATVNAHLQGLHSARDLAKTLHEGYDVKPDTLKVVAKLPKYLRAEFDRAKAAQLKTPALRAAYLQAIRAAEAGAGQAELEKILKVAFYERNRYHANRIARTEIHRAQAAQIARETLAEPEIGFVQLRLSSKHPKPDICDLHAKLDAYGLGAGVYPKAEAPLPPFHPHCYCLIRPLLSIPPGQPVKARPNAARAFLKSLPPDEARQVMGGKERLRRVVEDGDSVEAVVNTNVDPLYHARRMGEVGDHQVMPAFIRSSTAQQAEQEALKLGVKSADYRQYLDIANEINAALDDLKQRGLVMPDHARINDRFFLRWASQLGANPKDFPAAFVNSRQTGETYIFANPLYAYWNQLAQDAAQQHQRGEWSTAHPHHAIRHEMGHLLFYRANPARYAAIRSQQLTGNDLQTAHKVSLYAGDSAIEFIAETFALLVDGKTPPADVLRLYSQLGGIYR